MKFALALLCWGEECVELEILVGRGDAAGHSFQHWSYKLGRYVRIDEADLEAFIKAGRRQAVMA